MARRQTWWLLWQRSGIVSSILLAGNCAYHVGLVDELVMCMRILLCHFFETRIEVSQV
jgi:hypothetical protein